MGAVREGLRWRRLVPFHLDWIQVELSAECRGHCPYCPVEVFRESRQGGFMSTETFQALRPAFASADLVFLQGWGEPLQHPRIWEMAREAVASGARVGFTTNGVLLNRERREALLESGVEIVGVTLAGATHETHDRYRPGSPLEVLDRNVLGLREERKRAGLSRPALHVALQLLVGNLGEVEEMVAMASRWGAEQVVVSPLSLILSPELEEESLHHRPEAWAEAVAILRRARESARAAGMTFHVHGITDSLPQEACRENTLRSCFVSARGEVSPCVMANLGVDPEGGFTHRYRGEDHAVGALIFGNVREMPLREIWQSPNARAFRRAIRERIYRGARGQEGLPAPCRHCYKLLEA